MRFGSLLVLLVLNIMWIRLGANGYPDEVQRLCRDSNCGSHTSVYVNQLTVNIFHGMKNNVSSLPPTLRRLLAGLTPMENYDSTHHKLSLVEDVNQDIRTTFNLGEMTNALRPRYDRNVPDNADVGPDGFLYFLGTEKFDTIHECRGYCRRFRGFRLAIAKTKETLDQMRNYPIGMVDLAIIRYGSHVRYLWGDGTPLNRSILLVSKGEPVVNEPGNSDKFAMWPPAGNRLLNDHPNSWAAPCLCQGSSEEYLC